MDSIGLCQLEHPCKKKTLQFEATLVISVSEHEEDILDNACEVGLEEAIADIRVSASEVVDNL